MAKKASIVNILGVGYYHVKSTDGGDLYMTRFAEPYHEHLCVSNWFEKDWFTRHRKRLAGTSTVFKSLTKPIGGSSLELVVKYCRAGEDVPVNTHTLEEFCSAEFNSPWEEFSYVSEMRRGDFGPSDICIRTQKPLAIYVPPEKMQLWQSGRSRHKIKKITTRHPGIELDILKQYILIYRWIPGRDVVEMFQSINANLTDIRMHIQDLDVRVTQDIRLKGYQVADMKPQHIIIEEEDVREIDSLIGPCKVDRQIEHLYNLIESKKYSVIDYELLYRTEEHDRAVKASRRHTYLEDQKTRFTSTKLPEHLSIVEIMGVPYVYGHTESTNGRLWVVGRNAELFDYFLPERWRRTPYLSLSAKRDVNYTVTKDNIHIVWKTSRVGEVPEEIRALKASGHPAHKGINSLFEKVAISHDLQNKGFSTVYIRAIYMTGGRKVEKTEDTSRFKTHRKLLDPERKPILQKDHHYISICGYFNGHDNWVTEHEDDLYTPCNLDTSVQRGIITETERDRLLSDTVEKLHQAGYDGTLLKSNDLLLAVGKNGLFLQKPDGSPDVIICNFEFVWKLV